MKSITKTNKIICPSKKPTTTKPSKKVYAASKYRQDISCISSNKLSTLKSILSDNERPSATEDTNTKSNNNSINLDQNNNLTAALPPQDRSTIEKSIKETMRKYRNELTDDELAKLISSVYFDAGPIHKTTEPKKPINKIELNNSKQSVIDAQTQPIVNSSVQIDLSRENSSKLNGNRVEHQIMPLNPNQNEQDSTKPARLSMIDRKKLQWQREKEEMSKIEDYDPWGRHLQLNNTNVTQIISTTHNSDLHASFDSGIDNLNHDDSSQLLINAVNPTHSSSHPSKMKDTTDTNFHHRGKGFASLDLVGQNEIDSRRKKQLEYQEMILMQIEERKRLKEQEKAERLIQEQEDEIRIRKDQERLKAQMLADQSPYASAARRREPESTCISGQPRRRAPQLTNNTEMEEYLAQRLNEARKLAEEARHARVMAHVNRAKQIPEMRNPFPTQISLQSQTDQKLAREETYTKPLCANRNQNNYHQTELDLESYHRDLNAGVFYRTPKINHSSRSNWNQNVDFNPMSMDDSAKADDLSSSTQTMMMKSDHQESDLLDQFLERLKRDTLKTVSVDAETSWRNPNERKSSNRSNKVNFLQRNKEMVSAATARYHKIKNQKVKPPTCFKANPPASHPRQSDKAVSLKHSKSVAPTTEDKAHLMNLNKSTRPRSSHRKNLDTPKMTNYDSSLNSGVFVDQTSDKDLLEIVRTSDYLNPEFANLPMSGELVRPQTGRLSSPRKGSDAERGLQKPDKMTAKMDINIDPGVPLSLNIAEKSNISENIFNHLSSLRRGLVNRQLHLNEYDPERAN